MQTLKAIVIMRLPDQDISVYLVPSISNNNINSPRTGFEMDGCSVEAFLNSFFDTSSCLIMLANASQKKPQEHHVVYSFDTCRFLK